MSSKLNRRSFLKQASLAAAGAWMTSAPAFASGRSATDKLNIGVIGVANRASSNLAGMRSENIVALCDVDDTFLLRAAARLPQARTYRDFRKLLEQPGLDAVVVSTADHTHALATIIAMQSGMHVYCEKPLTHSVQEARIVAETAGKYKRVTQMGTQIHAGTNYRRVVELIQSGAIGQITECHVFCEKSWSGGSRAKEAPVLPRDLDFDLWLGPALIRPYDPAYLPVNWRRWWDFGGGTLGDMGCHYMDLAFWALKLRHPSTIEAQGPPVHPETTPAWLIVNYQFPAREGMSPVKVNWYDGGKRPQLISEGTLGLDWKNGVLFVGEKGYLIADYNHRRLLPEKQFKDFKASSPTIAASPGHHEEWLQVCKYGGTTTCNFRYAGALTETVLLGNVAYRTGKKLEWDATNLRATNCPEATQYIQRAYRRGWEI
ncbi:MAG TPA: Gfo/Idh/MocA family oxidoreductase [Candidatus Saccharimonadales bacterium]|nr:Gfo/Idh/MocA family oxidoreductase [Candidatus Saccharimonadales bacterium]